MARLPHVLVAWHAHRAGVDVLRNAIDLLQRKRIRVAEVLYLLESDDVDVPTRIRKVRVIPLTIPLNRITDHDEIYGALREHLLPHLRSRAAKFHINVSPGTPAMHAVWLILHAAGHLPEDSLLWATQKLPSGKATIESVRFGATTYLREVHRTIEGAPTRAAYEPEARSPSRRAALDRLVACARTGAPMLILGERGVGKTRLVETHVSGLKQKRVVVVPCGALDRDLAESRLFGYEKGAHSTADKRRDGLVHSAQGGVLFFDEIQDLEARVQRKLVRLLEERKVARIGQREEEDADVELCFGSNLSLSELRTRLDADLFDRLAMLIVEIPPLRDCREDLRQDWQRVWTEMRRLENLPSEAPWSTPLGRALGASPLAGNFRDLQRLALEIIVHSPEGVDEERIGRALTHWRQRGDPSSSGEHELQGPYGPGDFKVRSARFKRAVADWAYATHGDMRSAARALSVSQRSIRNWTADGGE